MPSSFDDRESPRYASSPSYRLDREFDSAARHCSIPSRSWERLFSSLLPSCRPATFLPDTRAGSIPCSYSERIETLLVTSTVADNSPQLDEDFSRTSKLPASPELGSHR